MDTKHEQTCTGKKAPLIKEAVLRKAGNDPKFITFLKFCSEQLKQGQEVQEIWKAWNIQESMELN